MAQTPGFLGGGGFDCFGRKNEDVIRGFWGTKMANYGSEIWENNSFQLIINIFETYLA